MKKIILSAITVVFTLGIASAQFINFGVKAGVNFSNLKFDDIQDIEANARIYNLTTDESFMGFHVGLMTRINITSAYIQPELYLNTAGANVYIEEVVSGTNIESVRQIKYNKIDLPVMVGYKFGPVRINAGPVASVVLSQDSEIGDIIPELETLSKSATFGYQAGAGLDLFEFLTIDYRFEGGLSKWGDKFSVGGTDYPFDSRTNIHLISLGIMF